MQIILYISCIVFIILVLNKNQFVKTPKNMPTSRVNNTPLSDDMVLRLLEKNKTLQGCYDTVHKDYKMHVTQASIRKIIHGLNEKLNGIVNKDISIKHTIRQVRLTHMTKIAAAAAAKIALREKEAPHVVSHIEKLKLEHPTKSGVKFWCRMLQQAGFSDITETYLKQLLKSLRLKM